MNEPCICKKPATVEKSGRVLCADCAKYVKGREYPLRTGKEMSANPREMSIWATAWSTGGRGASAQRLLC